MRPSTLALARSHAADPAGWCEECADAANEAIDNWEAHA